MFAQRGATLPGIIAVRGCGPRLRGDGPQAATAYNPLGHILGSPSRKVKSVTWILRSYSGRNVIDALIPISRAPKMPALAVGASKGVGGTGSVWRAGLFACFRRPGGKVWETISG